MSEWGMGDFQLAQANITIGRWSFDHPRMRGFTNRIDPVNDLAHRAPGFVWRPSAEQAMADLRALGRDPWREAFNMSVWESVEALWEFTFSGVHLEAVKLSARWFDPETAADVMWWVPAGYRPTVGEGLAKLDLVRANGPTADGFTFRRRFPPPDFLE
ncbi:protein of unknown function [Lentzea xinjiangensis]|uniref:DUF3291 domain-containing protein n=1 Tax=Lentzea xinjiangensis TaxID=402600 RepID=A0A1H9V7N4_9PSEU|nr:DUF3291 domain-containing protein [Lentzea xinjiangensis]SES17273.1 protein of unknown function [Lentzea xinjiangensis]